MCVIVIPFPVAQVFLMVGNTASSNVVIKIFTNSGPSGDPMATPSS